MSKQGKRISREAALVQAYGKVDTDKAFVNLGDLQRNYAAVTEEVIHGENHGTKKAEAK